MKIRGSMYSKPRPSQMQCLFHGHSPDSSTMAITGSIRCFEVQDHLDWAMYMYVLFKKCNPLITASFSVNTADSNNVRLTDY